MPAKAIASRCDFNSISLLEATPPPANPRPAHRVAWPGQQGDTTAAKRRDATRSSRHVAGQRVREQQGRIYSGPVNTDGIYYHLTW